MTKDEAPTSPKDAALTLALDALNHLKPTALTSFYTIGDRDKAITAIKEALAQPTSGDYALGYAEGFNDACKRQPDRTGWPAGLLQDDDRKLSKWLASKPDAKYVVDTERNFCPRCGKRLASGFVEISIHTCTPPQPEQPEEEQEIEDLRTPEERRDVGQWHCPECFTFGHVHRRGCVTANKGKNT